MAVADVKKLQIVGLTQDKEQILSYIQKRGDVELIGDKEAEIAIQELEYNIAQLDFSIKYVGAVVPEKVSLLQKLRGNKISMDEPEMVSRMEAVPFKKITQELADINANLNELKNTIQHNTESIKELIPWKELTITPAQLDGSTHTNMLIGMLSLTAQAAFEDQSSEYSTSVAVQHISSSDKFVYVVVAIVKSDYEAVKKILDEVGFDQMSLPISTELPSVAIAQLEAETKEHAQKIEQLTAKISESGHYVADFKIIYDYLVWKKSEKEAERFIEETDFTFRTSFWLLADQIDNFEAGVEKITNNLEFAELTIEEDEVPPVPLQNNKLFEPFESITGIYGVPKNNEPDPSPLLAPFFVVYFGLALTDAAYGIILAIGAYTAIKLLKIPKRSQKLFIVLIWGGVSTFIFGALFGGWFGVDITTLPPVLEKAFMALRVIDPLANPITVLIITLILGIFQVMVGIGIKGWWDLKHGRTVEAILDSGIWLAFLLGIILWIVAKVGLLPEASGKIFFYMILAAAVGLVLTQGRDNKNPILKLLMGILSLYGLVGYFSDVLSYSRLLALGLSTAIIASVVNLVAFLFKDMIPWAPVGWLVAIVILIGGHIFNMAINVLGAYIHSGRLQFVEFFPKFMEGGGRRFRPFERVSKYVQVPEEEPIVE